MRILFNVSVGKTLIWSSTSVATAAGAGRWRHHRVGLSAGGIRRRGVSPLESLAECSHSSGGSGVSTLTPAADHTGPPRQQAAVAPYLATDTCEASLETTWPVWTTSVLVAQFCLPVCGNMDGRSTLSSTARCRPPPGKWTKSAVTKVTSTLKTAATGEAASVTRWERSRHGRGWSLPSS